MSSASDVAKEKEMLKRDLYKELGIERDATDKDIKKVEAFTRGHSLYFSFSGI